MKLKPCPFCGSEDVRDIATPDPDFGAVRCTCLAWGPPGRNQAEVVEAWNRRAEQSGSARRDGGGGDQGDGSDQATVEKLLELVDELSPWESEFVGSISKWLASHDSLTSGQRKKAQQILEEAS